MSYQIGQTQLSGVLTLNRLQKQSSSILQLIKAYGLPKRTSTKQVYQWRKANLFYLLRGVYRVWFAEKLQVPFTYGALYLGIVHPVGDISDYLKEYADIYSSLNGLNFVDWARLKGVSFQHLFLGLAGTRVVTTAGVNFIVDAFQNSVEVENLKYHGIGTGSSAEGVGETALVTELTTEYTPDNTRATGTTTEGASANIYRTVATNTLSGAGASLREHGILSQAATGGGTLLDRTLFALITLADGDGLQSTYDLTFTAGS